MKTGPNQHFIPQVLLRRFTVPGDTRVHVYQLGLNEPRPTKKVASGRHFYSKPKEGEGDRSTASSRGTKMVRSTSTSRR